MIIIWFYKDTLYINSSFKNILTITNFLFKLKRNTKTNLYIFIADIVTDTIPDIITDIIGNIQWNNIKVKYTLFILARVCLQGN